MKPLALIAELSYRCPLKCVYCSNPIEMMKTTNELSTEKWIEAIDQAAKLGVMHIHFTGGEPTTRNDLEDLIKAASSHKLYTNLITSGIGLTEQRLQRLVDSGLEHVQLSFQGTDEASANEISGVKSHSLKLKAAEIIRAQPVGFTINVVVHRQNIEKLSAIIQMALDLGAQKLEIANVQYNGWAFKNRERLLPTRKQLDDAEKIATSERKRLLGKLRIDFVTSDYHTKYPKACMGGWGKQLMLMDPSGSVLPCHSAGILPNIVIPKFPENSLDWIWKESSLFQKFRGVEWMPEPCRSCDRKETDFGGCRCQAFLINGDPVSADPVCVRSPGRSRVDEVIAATEIPDTWIYRKGPQI